MVIQSKLSYLYHSIFSLFMYAHAVSFNIFPYSCMLMLLPMISMQPNPHDSLSTSLEIMCSCVTASTEKPSTPHRSRSSHDQIMKLIHHNKNPLSTDVSVAVYILVENVFPQNHCNPYGLRCYHHFVSLWIHNCRFLFVSSCWGSRQTGG